MSQDIALHPTRKSNANTAAPLLIALPAVVWWGYLLYYSVDIPWFDDLDPFSDFIRQWSSTPDLSEKIALLFSPNNEHRMIFGKLSALVYYLFTGKINFTFLHISGALFLCGTVAIFWRIFSRLNLPLIYFVPISFLFFQLKTHLVFLWAVCSLQHQPIVFFACLTLLFLSEEKFKWALVAAICATFSMGNGMLVWVAGGAILFYRKSWQQLIVWGGTGMVFILLYFSGMTTQNNESSFSYLLQHPHETVLGFFTFMGGLADIFPINQPIFLRSILPVAFGLGLSVAAVVFLFRHLPDFRTLFKPRPANVIPPSPIRDFLTGVLVFSLVNGLIIAVLRPRFGFFVFLLSNYKLYTFLFAAVIYLCFLKVVKKQDLLMAGAKLFGIIAFVIWGFSLWSETPVISERKNYLILNAYNQEHNAFGLGFAPNTVAAGFLDTLMKDLKSAQIYQFPDTYKPYYEIMRDSSGFVAKPPEVTTKQLEESISVSWQNSPLSLFGSQTKTAILFAVNEENLYVFPMTQTGYSGKNPFRQYERIKHQVLPYDHLVPGTYETGILDIKRDGILKYRLDTLFIPPTGI